MRRESKIIIVGLIGVAGTLVFVNSQLDNGPVTRETLLPPPITFVKDPNPPPPVPLGCDETLWAHVYHGRFPTAQDRLKVINDCVVVTGTIVNAKAEADGDFHIRVKLDDLYSSMLNAKNTSGQHGYLVVEPVCENPVGQRDTNEEGVCDNFSQEVFTPDMVGKHVTLTGAYVTDMEHGWNEIHPVTSIVPN